MAVLVAGQAGNSLFANRCRPSARRFTRVAAMASDGIEFATGQISERCLRKQCGIAARCGGVDGDGLLAAKPQEIVRSTGLGAGPGEAFTTKGLHTDDGADHVAIDIDISAPCTRCYTLSATVNPRLHA